MTAAHNDIIVIKLGGRTQSDVALPGVIADLWRDRLHEARGNVVIVHGGGDQISALQRMRGEEPVFVGGRRVSTEGVIEIVRMVLSGLANKQLVSALTAAGVPAVGISGEDAALLRATPIDEALFGSSGTPTHVDRRIVDALLSQTFCPVISPVATHDDQAIGGALNVNGDDAAAAIAAALNADELFLLADVPGVLDANRKLIASLSLAEARLLVASGVAGGGMAAKLDACAHALTHGVKRVRIGDVAALADSTAGTLIVAEHAVTPHATSHHAASVSH